MTQKWKAYAACGGADTSLFYPTTGRNAWQAKEFCDICPVKEECLEYALERPERHGVWGGMSERARGRLRAARKRMAEEVVTEEPETQDEPIDIFEDDTPLACGLEDVDICESCQ